MPGTTAALKKPDHRFLHGLNAGRTTQLGLRLRRHGAGFRRRGTDDLAQNPAAHFAHILLEPPQKIRLVQDTEEKLIVPIVLRRPAEAVLILKQNAVKVHHDIPAGHLLAVIRKLFRLNKCYILRDQSEQIA